MAMELVSLAEAAQRLGVSVDTIKRRLRKGELKGRQDPRPQGYTWLIEMPDSSADGLACPAGSQADTLASSLADLEAATVEIVNLREMLAMAQGQLAAQQAELKAKNQQITELHVLLQQAQKALPAPKEDRQSWWHRLWQRQR
jgi:hypothetical protein